MGVSSRILTGIIRELMLYSSSIDNLGLINGKMGISIFFFHYHRFTEENVYKKFGGELIDEIYDEIDLKYPPGFSDGLAGIAWGIEYLIRNRFVDADSDELLEELDRQIIKYDVRKMTDHSLEAGLKGFAHYIIARYFSRRRISPVISVQYVEELLTSLIRNNSGDLESSQLIHNLYSVINAKALTINPDDFLFDLIKENKIPSGGIFRKKIPLGIHGGYAGIGLKILNQTV